MICALPGELWISLIEIEEIDGGGVDTFALFVLSGVVDRICRAWLRDVPGL